MYALNRDLGERDRDFYGKITISAVRGEKEMFRLRFAQQIKWEICRVLSGAHYAPGKGG